MKPETVNKFVLLLIVIFISIIFLSMIRNFLMAIILAGIFSALLHPLYIRFLHWFRESRGLASLATLFVVVFLVLLPLAGLVGIVTGQAINVGKNVSPWVQKQIANPSALDDLLQNLPFYYYIEPYRELILRKSGEIVDSISRYLLISFSSVTFRTVNLVFMTFIFLYSMFFFLKDGDKVLEKLLYYLPLQDQDERRLLNKFTSVTRATLKGTAVIGILQGGLAGLAFWVVGIQSALFWGVIMIVLSIIPGIGTALVWVPAAFILAVSGHYTKAIGLALFCGLVVGSIDNFLRPILVGKDTQMHELMILFGTLGGIVLFGVLGIIIGPIVAALFVTVWDIYGIVFREVLPEVAAFEFTNQKKSIKQKENTSK
jgi:predicted PurR-regulated permease PerM